MDHPIIASRRTPDNRCAAPHSLPRPPGAGKNRRHESARPPAATPQEIGMAGPTSPPPAETRRDSRRTRKRSNRTARNRSINAAADRSPAAPPDRYPWTQSNTRGRRTAPAALRCPEPRPRCSPPSDARAPETRECNRRFRPVESKAAASAHFKGLLVSNSGAIHILNAQMNRLGCFQIVVLARRTAPPPCDQPWRAAERCP